MEGMNEDGFAQPAFPMIYCNILGVFCSIDYTSLRLNMIVIVRVQNMVSLLILPERRRTGTVFRNFQSWSHQFLMLSIKNPWLPKLSVVLRKVNILMHLSCVLLQIIHWFTMVLSYTPKYRSLMFSWDIKKRINYLMQFLKVHKSSHYQHRLNRADHLHWWNRQKRVLRRNCSQQVFRKYQVVQVWRYLHRKPAISRLLLARSRRTDALDKAPVRE